ncbi:hypothetical protein F5Y12DRAFT_747918 [Xylaria sp. FL1777]|nr:hypothetical protein F5Y12DRAFT_747918 [Xylaria sp. FL1777]
MAHGPHLKNMLTLLQGHTLPDESLRTLDIIVISSAGLCGSSEWVDTDGVSWLQKLTVDTTPDAAIWEFSYSTRRGQSFAQFLLDEGVNLLYAVYNHCAQAQRKLPLVFICHGTGGFVLKQALCICREQHVRYRLVIDVVSGAVFLGAPHLVTDQLESKKTFDLLLNCQNKGFGRSLSSHGDITALIHVCKTFELLNLKVPVVSAYEERETLMQSYLFSKFRRKGRNQVIVPRSMGVLQASTETVVGCHLDHFDICRVPPGSELYLACRNLIMEVLQVAPKRIAEVSQPYAIPCGLKDDTLRSPSTIGQTVVEQKLPQQSSIPLSSPRGGATGGSTTGSFEIVPAETALEMTSRDPNLPCFSLGTHRQLDHFIGRQSELDIIDRHLLPIPADNPFHPQTPGLSAGHGEEQLRSFAICGLGGIGKTELAVQYAHSRRERFEAIFWLSADDAKILASNFAQIAQKLDLEDDSSDLAASRDLVMGWLSRPLRKSSEPDEPQNIVNWLIIFDNVDNLDVLSDYWPKFGHGSVLVTSRDPFAMHNLYMENGMDLNTLSISETETLMQRLTHVKADVTQKPALAEMAHKLDGLPLAIRQLSGIFRQLRLLSYTEFLRYYNEEGIEKLVSKHTGSAEYPTLQSLATVWSLDRLSKSTKALLQVICLLDPDDIPEDLLVDRHKEVKLEGYPRSTGEYYNARSELVSSSLVNQNPELRKLSLHRLIQDSVKDMLSKEELIGAYQAAISLVINIWPFQSMKEHHSIARFSKCEAIFPSILRIKDGISPLLKEWEGFLLDIRLARLLNDTGWYMFERGLPEETKPFCELALLIGERLKGSLGEAAFHSIRESNSFLGIALVETNEHSLSLTHKRNWLSSLQDRKSEELRQIEDYELGYAYNEIGVAYGNENMLFEAAAAFHRSIEIFQGLDDYEDTMLGWPEPNLGFIYWMQGKLDEAEKALVEILDIHAAAWGFDDTKSFKTGKILYGLGNVLESQGRFDESLNFHFRCFNQFRKVLGMNHHRVGDICHRLAGHFIRQGLYKEAEDYLNSALRIFSTRAYLVNERARTTFRKGKLYQLMGQDEEAGKLLSESYRLRKQLRPSDNRLLEDLLEADFDQLVAFWSR